MLSNFITKAREINFVLTLLRALSRVRKHKYVRDEEVYKIDILTQKCICPKSGE